MPGFAYNCGVDLAGPAMYGPRAGAAQNDHVLFQISSPNPALSISQATASGGVANLTNGWGGGTYWNGSGAQWNSNVAQNEDSGPISSPYWGIQIVCSATGGCAPTSPGSTTPYVGMTGVVLNVQETATPGLIATGTDNLYYQTRSGEWVWNAAGDPWNASVSGSDPSGVCRLSLTINGSQPIAETYPKNAATWQQCPSPADDPATLDTSSAVPSSGPLTFVISDANAANNTSSATATVSVDNVAPGVSPTPTNDPNPGGWAVNHPVTLNVAPSIGPSGVSSETCADAVGGSTRPLSITGDQVTIDGNGRHTVSCTVANNAVNPRGAHHTGAGQAVVEVDEQSPTLSFGTTDPADPAQIVVQTADNESPVESGSITIAAKGSTAATTLTQTLNSAGQLVASIPDGSLPSGQYTITATARSLVGNTATAQEAVTLPLRASARSAVSFAHLNVAVVVRRVRERVRVGFHYTTRIRHGHRYRIKVGGHVRTITVLKRVLACSVRQVRTGPHSAVSQQTCHAPRLRSRRSLTVPFGHGARVYGELASSEGVPLAGQTIAILTAPANGAGDFTELTTARTNAVGGWTARLPAGPSRFVRASFGGDATTLPAGGTVTLKVPAHIVITATPRRVPWSGTVTIRGHLAGGYVPTDGVAMRLLIRLPGRLHPYSPVPFRTTSRGTFELTWSWGSGSGAASYPFSVATTATESDYPYLAAESNRVRVTFAATGR